MPAGLFRSPVSPACLLPGLAVLVSVRRASVSVPLPVYTDLAVGHACRLPGLAVRVPAVRRACLAGLSAQLVLQQLRCSPCRSTHAATIHGNGAAVPMSAS